MQRFGWGLALLAGIATSIGLASTTLVEAQLPRETPRRDGQANLITHWEAAEPGRSRLTVIDPAAQVMAVYHIDAGGEISLRGVRNFRYDLEMDHFNGVSPSPQEIRALLENR